MNRLISLVLWLVLCLSVDIVAQTNTRTIEKTDTSIIKVMYPNQDLKLWYGSDEFKVNDFVILPNYTILHSRKTSTLRLLANEEMLVLDNSKLLEIKTIRPHIVDEEEVAIGPIKPWFTVINDSTVLAGTALFKGRNKVGGVNESITYGYNLFVGVDAD
ncbi:hypothetical protein [Fibrella aquatilis]|uniref:Uncharacterized protein n=1 Tax=Fibrella aquatilis TaxID=2817059 RepID=A0A939GCF5_9BACT|nr:hypothetical protein [Fibrella aquatilis]MBO0934694.1 hypothetical protein [Fibrella aquatilis]